MFLENPILIKVKDVDLDDCITILEGLTHFFILSKINIKPHGRKFN